MKTLVGGNNKADHNLNEFKLNSFNLYLSIYVDIIINFDDGRSGSPSTV